jgi:hypothetical protein
MRSVLLGGGTTAPVSPSPQPGAGTRVGGRGQGKLIGGGLQPDTFYLWTLLGLELLATALLRQWSRNHHGG